MQRRTDATKTKGPHTELDVNDKDLRKEGGSRKRSIIIGVVVLCVVSCFLVWEISSTEDIQSKKFETDEEVIAHLSKTFRKSGRVYSSLLDALTYTNQYSLATMNNKQYTGGAFPTDKATRHYYIKYYSRLFEPYNTPKGVELLEVGVKMGGSIALWREFFSESSLITGLEISYTVPLFTVDPKIKIIIADSRDKELVDKSLGSHKFDIMIDDGNHKATAQLSTFSNLSPKLKNTGVYIIEDVWQDPTKLFEAVNEKGWTACWFEDTNKSKDTKWHIMIIYPKQSIAPRIGNCGGSWV